METEVRQLPLTDRAWAWFESNRKQASWGAVAVLVVVLMISLLVWKHGQKERVAGEALSAAAIQRQGSATHPDVAQGFISVANEYSKTPAGGQARLLAGTTLFVDGKYGEARAQFERFLREERDQRFMGQALLGIAACLEAEGKTNEAVSAYKSLVDTRPGDVVLLQAKFSLADLYEAQGKPELARSYFEEVARANPYSSVGSEAGIRLEELLKKHPELQPPPVPVTTSPIMALTNTPVVALTSAPAAILSNAPSAPVKQP